jgi:acetolactate synthase-1/2/3 large subunit
MSDKPSSEFARRNFLLNTAAASLVPILAQVAAAAPRPEPQSTGAGYGTNDNPHADNAAAIPMITERPGADFMVDAIKSLGFEYICANPGSSYRGLHESIVAYGGNSNPEFITCCHEESAVAMAHGYAKIEGKPLCVFLHGTVGLMHASMAIYNAYVDRAPVFLVLGNLLDATMRRPALDFVHSAQDIAAMVREFVKWDDNPVALQAFAESVVRGYRIATTPPMMPVLLVADMALQENPIADGANLRVPKLTLAHPPAGDAGAVEEAAKLLVEAEHPVLVLDRSARTQAGVDNLVTLAELIQAPVLDQLGRMNFPSRHPLNQFERSRALLGEADVVLGLELLDFWGVVNTFHDQLHRSAEPNIKPDTKLIQVTTSDLYMKSNYQDLHRFREVDLDIAADSEATVPLLIDAIRKRLTPERRRVIEQRRAGHEDARAKLLEQARLEASYGWASTPITVARICAELWEQIQNEDWSFVSYSKYLSRWPQRLWDIRKNYQFNGGSGGVGIGYNLPASTGAALANKKHGRLTVNIQGDGDMMYAPGVLWTSAHHKIPLLTVVHNNGGYHAEVMQAQLMSNRHNRGVGSPDALTSLSNPPISFSQLAKSMGVYAEGPIDNPNDLGPALKRAIAKVKSGEPALLDVISQGR